MTDDKPPKPPDDSKVGDSVKQRRFSARDEDFDGANDEAMAIRLASLEEEHRDLDAAIRALEESAPYERLSIARLKKKKLQLKDEIQELKDAMLPDIIA
ncbi:MAG: DUF465 domain-containing protein [Pseudomonadota bacterium]